MATEPPTTAEQGTVEGTVASVVVSSTSPSASTDATTRPKRPRRREAENGLPRWRRLHTSREFARVERHGARVNGALLTLTVALGPGRLGLVVSKKVDNRAAVRNLVKRRLREIFRQEKARYARLPRGAVDVVVIARPEARDASFEALRTEALSLLDAALQRLATKPSAPRSRRPRPGQKPQVATRPQKPNQPK